MKNFIDRLITGFFVFIFGIAWFCSTNYQIKQNPYKIIAYDMFGIEVNLGLRKEFQNNRVAISFIRVPKEFSSPEFFYSKRFS